MDEARVEAESVAVPRALVREALRRPITRRIVVTEAGVSRAAAEHRSDRPDGADDTTVLVCVDGTGWVELDGARTPVGARRAIVIPAGTPHAYGSSRSSPWTLWWCRVRGGDVPELIETIAATPHRPAISLRSVDRAVAMVDTIATVIGRDATLDSLVACAGTAWNLLTLLATDRLSPVAPDPLEGAMGYLAARLDGRVRVDDLARMVGLSSSRLSDLFHRATGGGVIAHHTSLRMAHARQLLATTTLSIKEIGSEVGYQDQFYFSRLFHRMHGQSPSGFRSQSLRDSSLSPGDPPIRI